MKRIILLTNLALICTLSMAQDTNIVYSKDLTFKKELSSEKNAKYKLTTIISDHIRIAEVSRVSDESLVRRHEETDGTPTGKWVFSDKKGVVQSSFDYKDHLCSFESDTQNTEVKAKDTNFAVVEQMPEFAGGNANLYTYLGSNIKYPEWAKESGIQGVVYVSFVIGKEGEIEDACLLKGAHPVLDIEALRVINAMPNWTPGVQDGVPVRVSYNLPVQFRLR